MRTLMLSMMKMNHYHLVTIRVCDSLTCELFGANDLMKKLESTLDKKKVRVVRAPCMGLCDKAPACEVGHNHLEKFSLKDVENALSKNEVHPKGGRRNRL